MADDRRFLQWFGRFQRSRRRTGCGSYVDALARRAQISEMCSTRSRSRRRQLQRANDLIVGVEHGRYLRPSHIPGALPSTSSLPGLSTCSGWAIPISRSTRCRNSSLAIRAELEPERVVREGGFHRHRRIDGAGRPSGRPPLVRPARRTPPRSCGATSDGSAVSRWTPPETASSPSSMDRLGPSAAPSPSRRPSRGLGIEIRAGLHAGEVEIRGESVAGLAVHIGVRVVPRSLEAGTVVVSSTVRDLVTGSGSRVRSSGRLTWSRACPDVWTLFALAT